MAIRKTLYISNERLWNKAEAQAKQTGMSIIEFLLDKFENQTPKKEEPAPVKSQSQPTEEDRLQGVDGRLRQKMKDRGEIVMSDEELERYRASNITAQKVIPRDFQKKVGLPGGKYKRDPDSKPITKKVA